MPLPTTSAAPSTPATGARPRRSRLTVHRGNLRTLLIVSACLVGRPVPVGIVVGWALVVVGAALHVWARGCLRINREVTTSGPYAWSRNPFYLGNALIDAGLLVVASSPWLAALTVPVWAWVHHRQIAREEQTLGELFGERYAAYVARVPRLVPWRGRVGGLSPSPGFTWGNPSIAEGKEFARLVRIVASPLVVFVVCALRVHGPAVLSEPRSHALGALALLMAATTLEWGLLVRIRHRRQVAPRFMRTPGAEVLTLAIVALAITLRLPAPQVRPTFEVAAGLALVAAAAVVLVGAPVRSRSEPILACAALGVLCVAAGLIAGVPWVGATGCAVLGLAATDRTGPLPVDRGHPRVRRALALLAVPAALLPLLA